MSERVKTRQVPLWADILLTLWIMVVAVVFFGPIIAPMLGAASLGRWIGAWTGPASVVYLLILILAIVTGTLKLLRGGVPLPSKKR